MRISDNMRFFNAKFNMQKSVQNLYAANNKVMTGKNFTKPSEAPSEANELLRLKTVNISMNQYVLNINRAENRISENDTILNRVHHLIDRARDFASSESNEVNDGSKWIDTDTRTTAGVEVGYVIDEMYDLANTKIDGKYVFSGFSTGTQPYTQATIPDDATIDLLTDNTLPLVRDPLVPANAYTYDYFGDLGESKVATDETLTIQTNLTGESVFGPDLVANADPTLAPDLLALPDVNVFYELDQLKQALDFDLDDPIEPDPNDYAGGVVDAQYILDLADYNTKMTNLDTLHEDVMDRIGAAVTALEAAIDQVEKAQIDLGTRLENIASRKSSIETFQLGVLNRMSEIEDVDMPTAITELRMMQTAYEVTINSSARFMQVSLMDFLR